MLDLIVSGTITVASGMMAQDYFESANRTLENYALFSTKPQLRYSALKDWFHGLNCSIINAYSICSIIEKVM